MSSLAAKLGVGVGAVLLLGGLVAGYMEYRETVEQVSQTRARWEAARESSEVRAERLADLRAAWQDTVEILNVTRDSLRQERALADQDTREAIQDTDLAAESLEGTLTLIRQQVRPSLVSSLDTALAQLDNLEANHRRERAGFRRQMEALEGLLADQKRRTDHWRGVADSALSLAEVRLHRALAAEEEREVWKSKARWDVLTDGPKALLYAAGGYAAGKGIEAIVR